MKHIPVYKPFLQGNESEYVNECLDSGWISSKGNFVKRFELEFAAHLGVSASTSVTNGTVALHLALYALDIGPGDEVIVPALTYIASVNAIAYVGAKPVFVDCDPDTWNLCPKDVDRKITKRTKAIMAVHLYGNPCDMNSLQSICSENRLHLIEDAAEAFGSSYRGKHVGGFGHLSTFSFFGNKTLTTGEGGMVVSNDMKLVERVAHIKNQSVSIDKEYWHDELGFNYRMTNICAALGVAQLEQAGRILTKKADINRWYCEQLSGLDITFQVVQEESVSSYWMVSILTGSIEQRNYLREVLKQGGVETRPVFRLANTMPAFASDDYFPNSLSISQRGINLPSYPDLTFEDVERVCRLIRHNLEGGII